MTTTAPLEKSPTFTAFTNSNGMRLIYRDAEGNDVAEATLSYEHGKGTIGGKTASFFIDDKNEQIELSIGDKDYILGKGNGDSFYCYLNASRPGKISLAQAKARMKGVTRGAPKQKELDDDLPF